MVLSPVSSVSIHQMQRDAVIAGTTAVACASCSREDVVVVLAAVQRCSVLPYTLRIAY